VVEIRLVLDVVEKEEDGEEEPTSCFVLGLLLPGSLPWPAGPCIALLNHIQAAFHMTSSSAIQSHISASLVGSQAWLFRIHCGRLEGGGHRWGYRSGCTCCRGRT